MPVLVRTDHRDGAAASRALFTLARRFLAALGLEGAELSVVVTTDRRIRALNRVFRDKDQATDVLSFPLAEAVHRGFAGPLGDVVISLDTARRRAKAEGSPLRAELALYLSHGVMHLVGHDHHRPEQARRMARAERRLLGGAGMIARAGGKGARG